jgi:hypothetical protein
LVVGRGSQDHRLGIDGDRDSWARPRVVDKLQKSSGDVGPRSSRGKHRAESSGASEERGASLAAAERKLRRTRSASCVTARVKPGRGVEPPRGGPTRRANRRREPDRAGDEANVSRKRDGMLRPTATGIGIGDASAESSLAKAGTSFAVWSASFARSGRLGDERRPGSGQCVTFTGTCETGLGAGGARVRPNRTGGGRRCDGSSEDRYRSGGTERKRPCRGSGRSRTQNARRGRSEPRRALLSDAGGVNRPHHPYASMGSAARRGCSSLKNQSVWVADVDRACLSAARRPRWQHRRWTGGLATAEAREPLTRPRVNKPERTRRVSVEYLARVARAFS